MAGADFHDSKYEISITTDGLKVLVPAVGMDFEDFCSIVGDLALRLGLAGGRASSGVCTGAPAPPGEYQVVDDDLDVSYEKIEDDFECDDSGNSSHADKPEIDFGFMELYINSLDGNGVRFGGVVPPFVAPYMKRSVRLEVEPASLPRPPERVADFSDAVKEREKILNQVVAPAWPFLSMGESDPDALGAADTGGEETDQQFVVDAMAEACKYFASQVDGAISEPKEMGLSGDASSLGLDDLSQALEWICCHPELSDAGWTFRGGMPIQIAKVVREHSPDSVQAS